MLPVLAPDSSAPPPSQRESTRAGAAPRRGGRDCRLVSQSRIMGQLSAGKLASWNCQSVRRVHTPRRGDMPGSPEVDKLPHKLELKVAPSARAQPAGERPNPGVSDDGP